MGAFENIPENVKRSIAAGDVEGHHRQSVAGGRQAALNRAREKVVYDFKQTEGEKRLKADAEEHAQRTRPGWDENYSPGPNE